ncbi:putative late blight resistance proteinR1B-16 [Sesamum angolense]|uniref:Late blight resistance proteinR1B-16 n=1 Tax=Sesamum angolense TaxID=2727404 RepID=A0AAE2BHN1_9LAMI|nr:putative late blight resistance proteinR1B-16 [Sesamum angolense]
MAAYAALVSLARTIHLILQNHHHSIFFHEYNQQINHILDQCTFLQAFLEDFPNGDDGLQARIRDVANEAEDVILDFLSQQIESHLNSAGPSQDVQPANQNGVPTASRKWFKLPKRYQRQAKIFSLHQKLRNVRKKADSIVQQVMKRTKNSSKGKNLPPWDSSSARSSSQLPAPSSSKGVVVGFEDDLMAVKLRLCGQSSKLQVVPILGMGGLKGMRYLIVMDDMWSTKFWDDVKMIFPDDDNGSRIIITTRLLDVASYMGSSSSSPPHEMHFLDEDQSWNLLRQIVFKQEDCPVELEKIGISIARSCGGLPLAIVVIAGLLSTIGFIKPSESKSFEEEAEYYLEDLVKRSLVLVTRRKTNGKIKICGVHDLIRDLCIRKAQEEKFLHLYVGKMLHKNIKYQHRISFMHFDLNSLENMYGSTIHTIICLKCRNSCPTLPEFCSFIRNFRLLKVLDVAYSSGVHLFPEVYELFHLRYLSVDYSRQIPATISNLQNLQTLILHQGKAFKSYGPWSIHLPLEIWRIPQLRHLVSFVFGSLPDPEGETFPKENHFL